MGTKKLDISYIFPNNSQQNAVQILEKIHYYVGMADFETGRAFYENKSFREITGRQTSVEFPEPITQVHPDWANQLIKEEAFPELLAHDVWIGRTAIYSENKEEIPVEQTIFLHRDDEGQPQNISTIMRDLRPEIDSHSIFEKAFDIAPVGMAIVGSLGELIRVNDSFSDMLGYSKSELTRLTFQQLTHPDDIDKDTSLYKHLLSGEIKSYQIEKRYYHKKGHIIWVELNASLVFKTNGEVNFAIGQVKDITEFKKQQQELESTRKDLEKSNQELERFASIISHDLKAPLRHINAFSGIVLDYVLNPESQETKNDVKMAVEVIQKGTTKLSRLIDDLRAFSRVGQKNVDKERIHFNLEINNLAEMFMQDEHYKGATITTESLPETIYGYKSILMQLFQNLLENSLKFIPQDKPAQIHISHEKKGREHIFQVTDNGIGIPKQHQKKIFELFKRLHGEEQYPGTGLGLALCQKIALLHGGSIEVESDGQSGTTFFVRIPKS